MKKLLALLLALVMVVSMAACGGNSDDETTAATGGETTTTYAKDLFPLEQAKSFTIIMAHDEDWDVDMATNKLWRELQSKTNVRITIKRITRTECMEELNEILLNGEAWDGIFTGFMSDEDYATLAAQDYFWDVSDYLTDEYYCPNFAQRALAGREDTVLKSLTTPDGGIYGLNGGDVNLGASLESPILVYKPWVEAAGKKVEDIKTIEDIEFLLDYWSKNDMNGNGKKSDEVPYLLCQADAQRNVESFLGLYGISTKDSTLDNYATVENGKVTFAPTTGAWKAAISKLSDWYSKGYIWKNAFKAENANAVLTGNTPIVGMMTANNCGNEALAEGYVAIAPVKVSGYTAAWYQNPEVNNPKALMGISRKCENPEILLAWFDQFLSMDTTVRYLYGEQRDQWDYTDDGQYEFLTLTEAELTKLEEKRPSLRQITEEGLILPSCLTAEDYEKDIFQSDAQKFAFSAYELYKASIAKESWPRPYLTVEQSKQIGAVRADVMKLVAQKRADWITGAASIDAQYDQFVKDLETMGANKMVAAMQAAYDVYLGK